ncbi:hypothetical protein ACTFIR_003733 [Dictyostelium discoideum]
MPTTYVLKSLDSVVFSSSIAQMNKLLVNVLGEAALTPPQSTSTQLVPTNSCTKILLFKRDSGLGISSPNGNVLWMNNNSFIRINNNILNISRNPPELIPSTTNNTQSRQSYLKILVLLQLMKFLTVLSEEIIN